MAGNLVISTVNDGAIGVKNAIINGNFQINQRGVSGTVTLAAGAYGHDRWKAGSSGCTYTFSTSGNVTTITISAGSLIQVIEGVNLYTGNYTLSWSGTAQGKIGAGSYSSSGVTSSVTGGSNLNVEFNTGTLSLVQLEPGLITTPFERRQFGTEVQLCQRYFEKSFDLNQVPAHNTGEFIIHPNSGALGCGGNTYLSIIFKVPKCARSGTLRLYDPFAAHTSTENWWRSFQNNCAAGVAVGPNAGFLFDVYENMLTGYAQAFTDGGVCFHWTVSSEL